MPNQKLRFLRLKLERFVLKLFDRIVKLGTASYRKPDKLRHLRAQAGVDALNFRYTGVYFFLPQKMLCNIVCMSAFKFLSGFRQQLSVQCHVF